MSAAIRVIIWLSSASFSAIPIFIIVAPDFGQLNKLFMWQEYSVAVKAIFLLYFTLTASAFFNISECILATYHGMVWRILLALLLLLMFLQLFFTGLFY